MGYFFGEGAAGAGAEAGVFAAGAGAAAAAGAGAVFVSAGIGIIDWPQPASAIDLNFQLPSTFTIIRCCGPRT